VLALELLRIVPFTKLTSVSMMQWDAFKSYDYAEIYQKMVKPAFVFDGRNILDHDNLMRIGFSVHAIGKRSAHRH
jgi:hypothetical protein